MAHEQGATLRLHGELAKQFMSRKVGDSLSFTVTGELRTIGETPELPSPSSKTKHSEDLEPFVEIYISGVGEKEQSEKGKDIEKEIVEAKSKPTASQRAEEPGEKYG